MHVRLRTLWLSIAGLALFLFVAGFWTHPLAYYDHYASLRMALHGARSQSIQVEGIRVHYYVMGPASGTPVVLVHGLGGRSEDWMQLAPYLTRAGYRVYLPDLPGYGKSQQPASFSYSVTDEGRIVVAFMDQLGLRRVDLGGWSMGGWIVQLIAANHPVRIRRLMLFDSAGLYARPSWDTNLFMPRNPQQLAELDALLMPHPPRVPDFVANAILKRSARNSWVIRRALTTMLSGREVTDKLLPRLNMPVLLVWGEADQITPLVLGEKMHVAVPQSQLFVVPGCGHLAPSQCAKPIGPAVVEFLAH